jgi:pimeloyl-ACP methyl ester carboxylesterase
LPDIQCPTLVLHSREDRLPPVEQGRKLAAGIRNARFIVFPSRNYAPPVYDPIFPVIEREVREFLNGIPA